MTTSSDILKDKKYPKWFSEHKIFKEITNVRKVFPAIGLPNSEEEIDLDNAGPAQEAAKQLVKSIHNTLNYRQESLKKYISSRPEMGDTRKANGNRILFLLNAVGALMSKRSSFIGDHNGRITIKLPENVSEDKDVVFRKEQSLFRVYNKINEMLIENKFAKLIRLEDTQEFKTFSSENVPNSKFKIAFSSDGDVGAWDIATMSMRGIKSCQSWDGEYKHCVIGSVVDPFVGIIYLTSGNKFSVHGTRMIRRCIVRFVVDGSNNKPCILLDHMYPNNDTAIIKQFKKYVAARTSFDVYYAPNLNKEQLASMYVPMNKTRKLLRETSAYSDTQVSDDGNELSSVASYQDIKIISRVSNKNDRDVIAYEANVAKKLAQFKRDFASYFVTAFKKVDVAEFPDAIKPTIRRLRGDEKRAFSYAWMVPQLANSIVNALNKSIDKKDFTSVDLFIRRLYYNYFNYKSVVIEDQKSKLTRDINGKLQLKGIDRLGQQDLVSMMNVVMKKVDAAMKANLRKLITKP